jgi:hypothetical protein
VARDSSAAVAAGAAARPVIARAGLPAVRDDAPAGGGAVAGDRPVVRPVRAAAPVRPAVQRVARAAPPVEPAVPVEPDAAPAPRPSLLRRIMDGLRGEATPSSQPVVETPQASPPRATITRVAAPAEAPRPRIGLQAADPEPAVSETPALRGTSPERLARVLGTEVQVDAAGNQVVEMPAPFIPFDTSPRTVSRATEPEAATPAAVTSDSTPAGPPPPPAPAVDIDQITETVIENIRRELVVEREQAGGPMDLT